MKILKFTYWEIVHAFLDFTNKSGVASCVVYDTQNIPNRMNLIDTVVTQKPSGEGYVYDYHFNLGFAVESSLQFVEFYVGNVLVRGEYVEIDVPKFKQLEMNFTFEPLGKPADKPIDSYNFHISKN